MTKHASRPENSWNRRAIFTVCLTSMVGWLFAYLSISIFQHYGWALFMLLPFCLGAAATVLYGFDTGRSKRRLFGISMISLLVFCAGLIVFAFEGLICIIMVMPIGLLFTWLGHLVGYSILQTKFGNHSATVILIFLAVPSLMAFENLNSAGEKVRSVMTSIEIRASPEVVWKNVVSFPRLKEPTEYIFKTGIAYPVDATIEGSGVGAIRYCNFSTGSFIEPITVWNEPHLLKFTVTQQPVPMKEISLYDIQPNHLHGYWVSKEGQFKLTRLANGNTLLEGTTWYVNKIQPGFYWTIWSDFIVHRIHKRVLDHIKIQAEGL